MIDLANNYRYGYPEVRDFYKRDMKGDIKDKYIYKSDSEKFPPR